jgi:hypothetical protein
MRFGRRRRARLPMSLVSHDLAAGTLGTGATSTARNRPVGALSVAALAERPRLRLPRPPQVRLSDRRAARIGRFHRAMRLVERRRLGACPHGEWLAEGPVLRPVREAGYGATLPVVQTSGPAGREGDLLEHGGARASSASWKISWPPGAAACVHQRAALVELSQRDGCEPELFGQGRHGSDRILVVARQKDDPVTALDDRIGGQGGRDQVIEAFDELGAGERLRDEGGGWEASSSSGAGNRFVASMMVLPCQLGSAFATSGCDSKRTARKMTSALTASASVLG